MFIRVTTLALLLASPAFAQPVNLAEPAKAGDVSRVTLELNVSGNLVVPQDGKKQEIKLDAKAKHVFTEKVLAVEDRMPSRSVRHYAEAAASAVVGSDKDDHGLSAERRTIVAARTADGAFCYSPAGPLTREELDVVSEHFDPHALAGLLPGKALNVGDTWAVTNEATHAAALFDSLTKNALQGKLASAADGIAVFHITGEAEGIENGAKVSLKIDATGKFHLASSRVVELVWRQTDSREQGPANPASKLDAVVMLKREMLVEVPKELSGANPGEPPAHARLLRFEDHKGRYRFDYPREWHITGQTDDHLILRLLDRGELVAQGTITAWKKAEAGKHVTVEEFKKAVSDSPGWVSTRILEEGEVAAENRWLYRLVADGTIESQPAVQAFHMLAGPQGDQVAVTFAMRPEKVKVLAGRDLALVKSVALAK
ncbi:MAG: hypothetical protein U0791_00025 [Gemmataceae bacterium]